MGVRSGLASTLTRAAKAIAPAQPSAQPLPQEMHAAAQDVSQMGPAYPFSPGEPIAPYDGYSRQPRQHNFTTAVNVATRPRTHERVSFATLRGLVESYDVAQIAIWHRIDSLRSLDWKLIAADGFNGDIADVIPVGMAALEKPDRENAFGTWLAKWLYDVLAYDAGALYRLRNRAGKCVGLAPVDGTTVAPLLDYWGNSPKEPAEAYVQYVNGLPWNWLTRGDLIYEPFRPRTNSPYGTAPLESIILNANTDLRFQIYFLQRYTDGNIPEAFASAPETWTPTQVEEFQAHWDTLMYGDQAVKHQIRWMPGGSSITWSNEKEFTDGFSLFMMRKSLAAYHVVPSDVGFTECYSEDTECLTDRGWLRYDELADSDKVAAYNPQTRAIEYHRPTHRYVAPYQGDMIHFKNRSVDVLVTPHHRMWAWTQTQDRNPDRRPWREIRAEDLASMCRFGFVGHAVHDAPDIDDDFLLPAVASHARHPVDRRIPMDLWLEFLGYMIAEGCVHRQGGSTKHYGVSISQSNRVNPEKVTTFTRCLEQLPISWWVADHDRDGCRTWSVGDKSLWTWLVANIGQGSRGKRLPDFFRQLGKRQATILLEALLLGDGTVDTRECSTGREYGTMSAQLASDVQELAYKLGFRVTSTCNNIGFWRVNITDGRDHQLGHNNVTRQPYKGMVWCVEVEHHLFITRRNGKITVQGNTVNRSSGESQADVAHKVGEMPFGRYVEGILTRWLKNDLGLPVKFMFDWGEEQDDRLDQAKADQVYIELGVVGASEIREQRYGLPEPEGRPVPRFILTPRGGPIPLNSLFALAGEVDQQTGAPEPGAPLPHEVFPGVQGVVPNPPIDTDPLAVQEFGPAALPPTPPQQPGTVAKEGAPTTGITSETGITSYDLIGHDEDEDEDEDRSEAERAAVAKAELAAFRSFRRKRRQAGEWRDFEFRTVPAADAERLNAEGRQAVRKAAGYELEPRSGMISLDLPPGLVEQVPGGVDDHHVTVVYLGPDVDDEAFAVACQRAQAAAAAMPGPLTGSLAGVASFPPSAGSDGKVPAYVPASLPGAMPLRAALADLSASEHQDWKPHVTLAYLGEGEPLPAPQPSVPVTFTYLSVHRGDQVEQFRLGGVPLGSVTDAEPVAKAGGADPKEGKAAVWPGWDLDRQAMAYWAPILAAALAEALSASRAQHLAAAYLADHPGGQQDGQGKREAGEAAVAWLAAAGLDLAPVLAAIAAGIVADGWLIGAVSAAAMASGTGADTGGWQPGDSEAAASVAAAAGAGTGPGSAEASAASGQLADGYMTSLGRALVDGALAGLAASAIGAAMVAAVATPVAAASAVLGQIVQTAAGAVQAVYGQRGIALVDILNGPNPCPECLALAESNPHEPGLIPVHRSCECAEIPHQQG